MTSSDRAEYLLIRDMPLTERPRERLRAYGPSTLSNSELLAIVWRTGTAQSSVLDMASQVIARFGSLANLAKASVAELTAQRGIGEAKAFEIMAALELGRRAVSHDPAERLVVRTPADVANYCVPDFGLLDHEQFRIVLLDTKNKVIANKTLYQGTVNRSLVRVGEVFREAVRSNASGVIVVHNHPSGDPTPSAEDIRVTSEIAAAGRLLDIELLDHLVIGGSRWLSMKERGLGFQA